MSELARLERALATVDPEGIDAELLARAMASLREAPHRFEPLTSDTDAAARLEAVTSLRLALLHQLANPRDVGLETARAAARAARVLESRERVLLRAADLTEDDRLRHDTLRFLYPTPQFFREAASAGERPRPPAEPSLDSDEGRPMTSALARLLERHEARPDREVPLSVFLGRKLRQHAMFYRFGFSAPLYALRARRFRARLPSSIRGHAGMRETYRAIEQLGPVLDNFVFDRSVRAAGRDAVVISDFAFLYMQLADELVDNLAKLGGDEALARLLADERDEERVLAPLESLTADRLSRAGLDPEAPIAKYGVRLVQLVAHVADLHTALVRAIAGHGGSEAGAVQREVRAFFHHCFATFLDELELTRLTGEPRLDRLPYAEVAWHFHRKNDEVMTRFMALRARLLGLDPTGCSKTLRRWGALLASFQIFDDLKDLGVDLGHQPSYPLMLARASHPAELRYLESRLGGAELALDRNEASELAVRAPDMVRDCLRWARLLARHRFDWFLDYVADTRWRRNWLTRTGSFHRAPVRDVPVERGPLAAYGALETGVPALDAFFRYLASRAGALAIDPKAELTYALDVAGYDHGVTVFRALLPDVGLAYRYANLRMRLSETERLVVVGRLLRRHRSAATRGLEGLRAYAGADAVRSVADALGFPLSSLIAVGARPDLRSP